MVSLILKLNRTDLRSSSACNYSVLCHVGHSQAVRLSSINVLQAHYVRLRLKINHQLKGEVPEDISEVSVVLQDGVNGYSIRLEKGRLIETGNGRERAYPLNEI